MSNMFLPPIDVLVVRCLDLVWVTSEAGKIKKLSPPKQMLGTKQFDSRYHPSSTQASPLSILIADQATFHYEGDEFKTGFPNSSC